MVLLVVPLVTVVVSCRKEQEELEARLRVLREAAKQIARQRLHAGKQDVCLLLFVYLFVCCCSVIQWPGPFVPAISNRILTPAILLKADLSKVCLFEQLIQILLLVTWCACPLLLRDTGCRSGESYVIQSHSVLGVSSQVWMNNLIVVP